jgi:hypothetical protein
VTKAILTFLAWTTAGLSAALLGAWALGRAVTDSWGWSQFLYWIPSPLVVLMAFAGLAASTVTGLLARRYASEKPARVPAARARLVLWACWLGSLAFMLLGEWHSLRYLSPVSPPPGSAPFRVLSWNAEVDRLDDFEDRVMSQEAAVIVIANGPRRADWQAVRRRFGAPTWTARGTRFTVVSKFRILRWGTTDLRITGSRPRVAWWTGGGNIYVDTGDAMFVELDTTAIAGHTTVIWGLDLPSDPRMIRSDVMHLASDTLTGFVGPIWKRDDGGLDQRDIDAKPGFPAPDLIVGDCNTPRGSASLAIIAGSMSAAFDQAGRGFEASWPRKAPIIAIDQAFVGPRLRAVGYDIVDLGAALHRAEVIDLIGQ